MSGFVFRRNLTVQLFVLVLGCTILWTLDSFFDWFLIHRYPSLLASLWPDAHELQMRFSLIAMFIGLGIVVVLIGIAQGRNLGLKLELARQKKLSDDSEQALAATRDQLQQVQLAAINSDRLRTLGEMSAGIAHELNQPLTGVRGLAEHLLLGFQRGWQLDDGKVLFKLEKIIAQADRMTHVLEHIRTFAREAGSPELRISKAEDVVRQATQLLGTRLREHGVELRFTFEEALPNIRVNPFSLEEVLVSVISNARDAVAVRQEERGIRSTINIRGYSRISSSGTRVVIEVEDNGMGIPPNLLGRVFEPFFTTKGPSRGSGLGLPVSRALMESMGGGIDIRSEPSVGTTVMLWLPAMTPEFKAQDDA